MSSPLRMASAIVGAAETEELGIIPDKSALQLHADAAIRAMEDAGVTNSDIDAVLTAGSPTQIAEYLGIQPTFIDGTSVGGCSFMLHVAHAAAALALGRCNVALITHGQSGRSRVGEGGRFGGGSTPSAQFEDPYGTWGAPSRFTIPFVRHMHEYGTTEEQLASVAVAQRRWATKNPRAMMRDPIEIQDVLDSRLISWPFHLFECCLVTDGGGALIMVAADRAKDFPKKPVYVMGMGESAEMTMISQMHDFTSSRAFVTSGQEAFKMAEIERSDVDHIMIYDAFAHLPIFAMEDLGFLKKGEAGPWFAEMKSAPGGEL
ncbi:MAG: thiolase, partial [Chloroflexi bacterium]|nr:thiolase [Chloroflexota bacterium]